MTQILKAKPLIEAEKEKLKLEISKLKNQGITPTMKVILVGSHPPSLIYTRNKKKFCEELGGECEIIHLDEKINELDFLKEVDTISNNNSVHGCFIQLPLHDHLKHIEVDQLICPEKDVDGFHPINIGKLYAGNDPEEFLAPCTPKGVMKLLRHYNIPVKGKNACVIGRSVIVGKPMMLMLDREDATVTLCHKGTKDTKSFSRNADIIVTAVGISDLITKEYIGDNKPVVIDVGINYNKENKLCGDADFEGIKDLTSAITPVPGGVGPLTILSLMHNLVLAAKNSI